MKRTLLLSLSLAFSSGFAQESKELAKLKFQTNASVTMSKSTSNPNFIRFENPAALQLKSVQAKAKVDEFLAANFKAFNLNSSKDLVFVEEFTDSYGLSNVVYRQYFQGVPVYDGILKFHFNGKGQLSSLNGNTLANIKVNANPTLSQAEAGAIAKNLVIKQGLTRSKNPLGIGKNNLLIFPKNLVQGGQAVPYLAYEVEVTNKNEVREFLFIDAHTGDLVEQFTGIHPIDRKLYETSRNPSNLKWKEGDALPGLLDQWQQSEVITSEHVYNFFKNAFNYISFNNNDATMITVNNDPGISCPNANWNGVTANYCTGTASDDVVAHEWGHAYTEYTSGLIYQYQSGALNESYSDVWGETIDLMNGYDDEGENLAIRTTTTCSGSQRWKMGEKATAFGSPIRDLWNPNCNNNPGRVLESMYYCGTGDSGGVHRNSGVPNHLYALLVDGGTYNGYTISSVGFVKAAHLWWRAQRNYLTRTSDFAVFADALEAAANDLVGVDLQGLSTSVTAAGLSGQSWAESDMQNLKNAILSVQLRSSPNTQCNYLPLLKPTPALCTDAVSGALFTETWENGLGNWTVSNVPTNPASWENRNWVIKNTLPKGRTGKGIFGADPVNGNCTNSMQNGILRLESPVINFPTFTAGKYEMAFNHYVATEAKWDGGNIKYSLNGGTWTVVPKTAFSQNAYNINLDGTSQSDNPMKGQGAFSGTDGGSLGGSWGQSVIDLSKIGVVAGANLQLRFEMGTDGCNGNDGWYLDELYIYNCTEPVLAVEASALKNGVQVYPNPTAGLLTIQNNKQSKLNSVQVYSVTGQLVTSFKLDPSAKNSTIDLSTFAKGTYLIKVNSDTESNTIKVIKK
ncbi:M4 family metallopeptidase [Kaistella antarctica]|uniref:Bacillolysin n=1 Tax=Kaistella antarctica TaxID=266748 RepID=A0A448NRI7_9FLAO|nr:M4 family metallopeptidase [Kaistella antarctica]KEY18797.1 bacillolysin [Kaistella antarctica]SEW15308.1 Por secretion system C-terminal sorting domain-containing protein [Kaistella antarctica]VEH99487.1 Bacillolysin precursor [Kaistella antarctica]